MGVSEARYGWLTDRHRLKPGEPLDSGRLIQPRAEPEIAFITSRHLEGPVGLHDVPSATAAVAPALNILDSRFAGYPFTLADMIADNCSAGAFVVGNPVPLDSFDLGLVGCVFEKNGKVVGTAAEPQCRDTRRRHWPGSCGSWPNVAKASPPDLWCCPGH